MLTIFKKELRSHFSSLIAYVVIAMFLIVAGYSFYTYLVMFLTFVGADLKVRLWQFTFHYLRFAPLTLIPLLTMRLFAEEKKMGTIELLFTAPVRDFDIIMGKYAACLLVYMLMLALTLLYPALIALYFTVEPGPLLSCYLGLFLLGAACIACGTFVSSLTENQIVASIVTIALLLTLWNLDWNEGIAGSQVIAILHQVSLSEHFLNFIKGVIDTNSVIYYVSLVCFFLFLTRCSLASRAWRGLK
jgi:ABC-2 type transport system permease protein